MNWKNYRWNLKCRVAGDADVHHSVDVLFLTKLSQNVIQCKFTVNQKMCATLTMAITLSILDSEHISGTAKPTFTKCFVHIPCGGGSVLLWWLCAMLRTSGFMDDVTFGRNGRDAESWRLHRAATAMNDMATPGRSLMSMNACDSCDAEAPTPHGNRDIRPSNCQGTGARL